MPTHQKGGSARCTRACVFLDPFAAAHEVKAKASIIMLAARLKKNKEKIIGDNCNK